ncbi:MAG: hypothetical protein EOM26_11245 [Alphaproteobacteria bacterium]|nr:hypothetical protein [Alphaproteobacteria bacterium]
MKGKITANQGESRYTISVDADTALLQLLIAEKEKLNESIIQVLYGTGGSSGLYAQEREHETAYNDALQVVTDLTTAMNEERAAISVQSCLTARLEACDTARSDARQACRDAAVDCRNGCDGSLECLQACDDDEDLCEAAADRAWEACTAQANLDCVDFVSQQTTEIFTRYSPLIAAAQADAIEALTPLQATRTDIAQWEAQRLSVDQALTQLKAIEARGIAVTCWSAQYDDQVQVDAEVEIAQTPSGRHVITAIGSVDNCLHDAHAVPAYNLFVNAALNPGVETWRPRWRTGIVKAINDDDDPPTLTVEVTGGEMYGTLGTVYSRREINCTPPQAYFDEDGDIDSTGAARDAYDDALEAWQSALAARDACYAEFDGEACLTPLYETCATNLDADRLACLDVRAIGIAACAGDPGCEAYVDEQYQSCLELADANAAACYAGADTQCQINRAVHDANCDSTHTALIGEAQQALSDAERDLRSAIAMIREPASPLVLDLEPAHCSVSSYEVDDDVLIGFESRAASVAPEGSSSSAIRAAAMAVWNSAKVYGWASDTKLCRMKTIVLEDNRTVSQKFDLCSIGQSKANVGLYGNGSWSSEDHYAAWTRNSLLCVTKSIGHWSSPVDASMSSINGILAACVVSDETSEFCLIAVWDTFYQGKLYRITISASGSSPVLVATFDIPYFQNYTDIVSGSWIHAAPFSDCWQFSQDGKQLLVNHILERLSGDELRSYGLFNTEPAFDSESVFNLAYAETTNTEGYWVIDNILNDDILYPCWAFFKNNQLKILKKRQKVVRVYAPKPFGAPFADLLSSSKYFDFILDGISLTGGLRREGYQTHDEAPGSPDPYSIRREAPTLVVGHDRSTFAIYIGPEFHSGSGFENVDLTSRAYAFNGEILIGAVEFNIIDLYLKKDPPGFYAGPQTMRCSVRNTFNKIVSSKPDKIMTSNVAPLQNLLTTTLWGAGDFIEFACIDDCWQIALRARGGELVRVSEDGAHREAYSDARGIGVAFFSE